MVSLVPNVCTFDVRNGAPHRIDDIFDIEQTQQQQPTATKTISVLPTCGDTNSVFNYELVVEMQLTH